MPATSPPPPAQPAPPPLDDEREELLERFHRWLEGPMVLLGFVWLGLLVAELLGRATPGLLLLGKIVWIVFVCHFALELVLAPVKGAYLKRNWLTVVSLVLPALRVVRVLRVVRFARAARGLSLVRLVTSANRGMRALGATMSRRGFGYVVALTTVVTLVGAAGMYAFEHDAAGGSGALDSYPTALWWTAMLMTTMGSDYWPKTPEGRVLCFLLALYGFAVFGYVTAALASFFVGRDADETAGAPERTAGGAARESSVAALRDEIAALRAELRAATTEGRRP